jgi:hypothetical protein
MPSLSRLILYWIKDHYAEEVAFVILPAKGETAEVV